MDINKQTVVNQLDRNSCIDNQGYKLLYHNALSSRYSIYKDGCYVFAHSSLDTIIAKYNSI